MTRPRIGEERQLLASFLDQQRDVIVWKLEGLTDHQLRQRVTPGGLYLLGLVKHLDATAVTWRGDTISFRWAILHVIEETVRHAGHADFIREHIDGTTGYMPDDRPY